MYQKRCNGIIHEVKKGDSLYTISREHNVPLESVMLANPDVDIYNLQIGSKICVPMRHGMNGMDERPYQMKMDMNTDMYMDTKEGVAPEYTDDTFAYIVRDGDSMQNLMNKFGVDMEELCRYNSMDNIMFKPGIAIIIPNK